MRLLHTRNQVIDFKFFILKSDLRRLSQLDVRLTDIGQLINLPPPTFIGDTARACGLSIQNPLHHRMLGRGFTHQDITGKVTIELVRGLRTAHSGSKPTQIGRTHGIPRQINIRVQRAIIPRFPLTFEVDRLHFIAKKRQIRTLRLQPTARLGQRTRQIAVDIQITGKTELQLRQIRRANVQF